MAEFQLAPIDRLIRKAGADRVSADAVTTLRDILEDIAYEIAKKAVELAHHAKRKTVTGEDVKLAYRALMG